ncbi:MAG: hypothetical protein ABI790_02425 [Betaproteobacteria bacterium]
MIIVYRRPRMPPVRLAVDDAHCDRLLDWLSAQSPPNAEADLRWEKMIAARDAAEKSTGRA